MKLGKLKMPSKKAGEEMSDKLFSAEAADEAGADADFANELVGESEGEDADAPELDEMGAEMESISDEDLLAEIKRRGLSSKLDAPAPSKKKPAAPAFGADDESEEEDEY
jgi:hypothetical protein